MQLWKYSGILLLLTGVLHNVVGFILGWDILLKIARDGFINAVDPDFDRNFIFWFLFSGLSLMIMGHLAHWIIKKRKAPLPSFLGWYLLALAFIGGIMMPVSGFWLFIPQGFIIIFPKNYKRSMLSDAKESYSI